VPTGTIVLWYSTSASIPTGWTPCDGVAAAKEDGSGNITPPDLRDKFVVAAGSTYTQGSTGGSTTSSSNGAHTHTFTSDTGGSHTHGGATGSHTLTTSEIPAHTHLMFANVNGTSSENLPLSTEQVAVEWNNGTGNDYSAYGTATAATLGLTSSTGGGGGHTHTISSTGSTHSHTGTTASDGAHTHTVTPPYYALVYMMRL
jgi:microcystin-dependent protein